MLLEYTKINGRKFTCKIIEKKTTFLPKPSFVIGPFKQYYGQSIRDEQTFQKNMNGRLTERGSEHGANVIVPLTRGMAGGMSTYRHFNKL